MTDLLFCIVPNCENFTKRGRFREWMCPEHWQLISWQSKWAKHRAYEPLYRYGSMTPKEIRLADEIWERCKAEAIERAMGVG